MKEYNVSVIIECTVSLWTRGKSTLHGPETSIWDWVYFQGRRKCCWRSCTLCSL